MNIKYFFGLLLLIGVVTRSTTSLSNVHPTDEATTPKTSPLPDYFTEDEATTPFPDYYEDYYSEEVEPDKTTYEPTYQPTTTTYEPTTTTYEPTTTTCEPTTTTCGPTTTKRTTTPKPTRTTTPKPTTKPPPSWKAGVYEHVAKCKAALKFYVGPTYKTAKTLLDAFLCLIPKLEHSTTSQSAIISSYSEEILGTISIMSEVGGSPSGILNGFENVLSTVCNDYANIILRLGVKIGVSTSDVANAVTELEVALCQIIADWKNAAPLHIGDDNIDYEPVLKSIQKLTNAVACVSKAALRNCENDANVRDSLYILALIFDHLVIIGHATNVSIAADLNVRCGGISDPWSQCLKVIDNLVSGLTKALNAVVKTVLEAVISIVKAIVDLAKSLNEVLKTAFGLVENLTNSVSNTLKGVTGGLSNILKIGK